jgi:hypothetical protein
LAEASLTAAKLSASDGRFYRFFPVDFVFSHHFTGSGSAKTASG